MLYMCFPNLIEFQDSLMKKKISDVKSLFRLPKSVGFPDKIYQTKLRFKTIHIWNFQVELRSTAIFSQIILIFQLHVISKIIIHTNLFEYVFYGALLKGLHFGPRRLFNYLTRFTLQLNFCYFA